MLSSPGAIAIHTPYLDIYWYGIIIAVAFLIGQFIIVKIAEFEYHDKNITDNLYEIAFYALLSGIIGARLYYVILSFDYYSAYPLEIIMLHNGGVSIHGGLIGGILGMIFYCKKKSVNFFQYADLYALGLPVAQSIGRWGNFFNSEAFGLPTDSSLAVFIPLENRPNNYMMYQYFQPTFLYESVWDMFVFISLFFVIKKYHFKQHGVVFFSYLILYSYGRLLIEQLRTDSVLNIFGIKIAMIVCVITILISVVFLFKLYSKYHKG